MPNPKRKFSHQRTAKRRTHYTTDLPEVTPTKNVGGEAFSKNHCASPDGYYKGRRLPGFRD
ncbi:MAG: 50S ribosomal protein L32 [Fimbriimonadaceae bacterium]|nr:50S ribosomal protein L32 [Fimbriimonadaceae bacterium]QYK56853.1 MAG: 50S ribosomal protein L32 [Fimbriimonadaceae bacterium]